MFCSGVPQFFFLKIFLAIFLYFFCNLCESWFRKLCLYNPRPEGSKYLLRYWFDGLGWLYIYYPGSCFFGNWANTQTHFGQLKVVRKSRSRSNTIHSDRDSTQTWLPLGYFHHRIRPFAAISRSMYIHSFNTTGADQLLTCNTHTNTSYSLNVIHHNRDAIIVLFLQLHLGICLAVSGRHISSEWPFAWSRSSAAHSIISIDPFVQRK